MDILLLSWTLSGLFGTSEVFRYNLGLENSNLIEDFDENVGLGNSNHDRDFIVNRVVYRRAKISVLISFTFSSYEIYDTREL